MHPLVWGTSNGDFQTTKNGNVDIKFTEFSRNKIFSIETDIVVLDKNAPNPIFDMILGVGTLREFGVILNFVESTVTIDHHEVRNTQQGTFFPRAPADPVSVAEATDRTQDHGNPRRYLRKRKSSKSNSRELRPLKFFRTGKIAETIAKVRGII